MADCPFNKQLLDNLLCGETTDEERERLRSHLELGCRECERFFSELDSDYDEMIMALYLTRPFGDREKARLSLEAKKNMFASLEEQLSTRSLPKQAPGPGYSGFQKQWKALALAAAIILVVGVSLLAERDFLFHAGPTHKGEGSINEARIILQFSVLKETGEPDAAPEITRGVNRASYRAGDHVLFRYELDEAAWVYIVRAGPDGRGELLYPASGDPDGMRRAGVHDANQGDNFLAHPLKDLDGLQTFCAIARTRAMSDQEQAIRLAIDTVEQDRKRHGPSRLRKDWIDCIQLKVDGSWEQ